MRQRIERSHCNVCGKALTEAAIRQYVRRCSRCRDVRRTAMRAERAYEPEAPPPPPSPLTDEQRAWVESVMPMAKWGDAKFTPADLTQEQRGVFLSMAYEKMMVAARSFTPARGAFTTYFGNVLRREAKTWYHLAKFDMSRTDWEALTEYRKFARPGKGEFVSRAMNAMSLEGHHVNVNGWVTQLADIVPDKRDDYAEVDERLSSQMTRIDAALAELGGDGALLRAWAEGRAYNDLAEEFGVSPQRVHQRVRRAKERARRILEGKGK